MTTIVDLDTGRVLGIMHGRDHKGVGDWLFARPLQRRMQTVARDPSAAFRKALITSILSHWPIRPLPRAQQNLSQQVIPTDGSWDQGPGPAGRREPRFGAA
jgi:transposase